MISWKTKTHQGSMAIWQIEDQGNTHLLMPVLELVPFEESTRRPTDCNNLCLFVPSCSDKMLFCGFEPGIFVHELGRLSTGPKSIGFIYLRYRPSYYISIKYTIQATRYTCDEH